MEQTSPLTPMRDMRRFLHGDVRHRGLVVRFVDFQARDGFAADFDSGKYLAVISGRQIGYECHLCAGNPDNVARFQAVVAGDTLISDRGSVAAVKVANRPTAFIKKDFGMLSAGLIFLDHDLVGG